MGKIWPLTLLALAPSEIAFAQTTTNCQWNGSVWTCNQSSSRSGIDWGILERRRNDYNESVQRGMDIGDQIRRSRDERERIRAETEMYRAQTQAAQRQAQSSTPGADYLQIWYEKAKPRMRLFPDFEAIVFAEDVNISTDMVMLMSSSDYAADIAYHLATHKAEAMAISRLSLLDAARAIDAIEEKLISIPTPSAPE